MNIFQGKKIKKLYHRQSDCISSFDFRLTPVELRQAVTKEEFNKFMELPLIRIDDRREILVNEAVGGWEVIVKTLSALDSLMDMVLYDMYSMYEKRRSNVTAANIRTFNDEETCRRIILCLIPEVLWCHGDDNIKSRLF